MSLLWVIATRLPVDVTHFEDDPWPGTTTVVAKHPETGTHIGWMELKPYLHQSGHYVDDLEVEPEHRRKGVASAMWQYAKEQGLDPHHTPSAQSDDGIAWSKAVGD
jgi:GNAT superfamily N-acetyltransferase